MLYTSSFKPPLRWLRSLTPVTYRLYAPGIHSLAALTQLEFFCVNYAHVHRDVLSACILQNC
ncbi:hypothetical protein DN603_01240 [Raoultella planticola]|uniref:Uncharacterized protein n=1 Tax=Raoultella planticola TaxID=575 RepID=A0A443VUX7_RAOPL|nr:hypothetical protein DMB90_18705 [Raoultella planticola]RWT26209.1 hypothetical protein DN603_01240 [Raoultella planticola]